MSRRPDRTSLALALPVVLFVGFGMARVAAPVSALGLVFHQPLGFAVVAAATALGGAALLLVPRFELLVARAVSGAARLPTEAESARLDTLLDHAGGRAGIDPGRLLVRVQDAHEANAAAGGGHLLFVTTRALRLPDEELEAILAHELGHHRGLHPVLTSVVWWLSLPGVALGAVYRVLRRTVAAVGARFGSLGRLLAVPLVVVILLWQIVVMWLFYLGELLSRRAARVSEFSADAAAARWGYGPQLAASLDAVAGQEAPPDGRLGRLMADHPPIAERVERLS